MADFARADCLIVRPTDAPALPKGSRVTIIPL
jgi:molybdopterin biosynthesis enzyme